MAVIFQVNGGGGANELEVSDDGTVKVGNVDMSALLTPGTFIADPAGGGTVDTEARAAVASILDLLIAAGLMEAS